MPCRFDKVQASVHAVVDHLLPVDAVLLLEVGVEPRLDVVQDRFPAVSRLVQRRAKVSPTRADQVSL